MSHKYLMPFLAAAFLVAPAVLPRALVSAIAPGVSGTAQAKAINLNSSRSNNYRTAKTRGSVTTPKASGGGDRMGGGGGSRTMGAERMGGGGGGRTK
jgi:hypothetical protein